MVSAETRSAVVHHRVAGEVRGAEDLGRQLGLERARRGSVQPRAVETSSPLPADALASVLDARLVELHGEHPTGAEGDVDVAGLAQLTDERGIERAAGEAQIEEGPGAVCLGLGGEDSGGGAGGLGAGDAPLEHGAPDAGLLQPPGDGAADHARPDDQHLHQRCSAGGASGRTGMGGCGSCGPVTDGGGGGWGRWVIHHSRANTSSARIINNSVRSGKRRGPPERVGGVVSNGRICPMTVGA